MAYGPQDGFPSQCLPELAIDAILESVSELGHRLAISTPFVDGVLGLIEEKLRSDHERKTT